MNLLVLCPRCERQYEAPGWQPGSKFHCLCGEVLEVRAGQGHEAAVVRCSACGGPREGEEPSCQYCGAAFTTFETDRDTACPRCFTRISRQAQYCHSCGLKINPQPVVASPLELECPKCQPSVHLHRRQWAGFALVECPHCGGMWISQTDLKFLLTKVNSLLGTEYPPDVFSREGKRPKAAAEKAEKVVYYPCPVCRRLMNRRRYPSTSVIVDTCRDHGLWFDAEELGEVLRAVRQHKAEGTSAVDSAAKKKAEKRTSTRSRKIDWPSRTGSPLSAGVELLAVLIGLVMELIFPQK